VCKVDGELISLDESGFVVIESNGKRILIKKELVEIMHDTFFTAYKIRR